MHTCSTPVCKRSQKCSTRLQLRFCLRVFWQTIFKSLAMLIWLCKSCIPWKSSRVLQHSPGTMCQGRTFWFITLLCCIAITTSRPVARGGGSWPPPWTLEVRSKTETTCQFTVQVSISGLLYIINKNMLRKNFSGEAPRTPTCGKGKPLPHPPQNAHTCARSSAPHLKWSTFPVIDPHLNIFWLRSWLPRFSMSGKLHRHCQYSEQIYNGEARICSV